MLAGYFRMKNDRFLLNVFTSTRLVAYGISCFELVQGQGEIIEEFQEAHIIRGENEREERKLNNILER
ncbi:unnamed protein product [Rhizophagus irregularis]|nr:unnamed protein product [Rhizophagus irregularis]